MTRAQVQADRIRGCIAFRGTSLRQVHIELENRKFSPGVYETLRRRIAPNVVGGEMGYSLLKGFAEVLDAPIEWVAGEDDAPFPDLHMGVYVSSDPACAQAADCPLYAGDGGTCLRGVACRQYTVSAAA